MKSIPLAKLEGRRVYRIVSRNLVLGVWNPETKGFIGIREKFGSEFLFTEYNRETGGRYGTATPIRRTRLRVPESVPLVEYFHGDGNFKDNDALFALLKKSTDRIYARRGWHYRYVDPWQRRVRRAQKAGWRLVCRLRGHDWRGMAVEGWSYCHRCTTTRRDVP